MRWVWFIIGVFPACITSSTESHRCVCVCVCVCVCLHVCDIRFILSVADVQCYRQIVCPQCCSNIQCYRQWLEVRGQREREGGKEGERGGGVALLSFPLLTLVFGRRLNRRLLWRDGSQQLAVDFLSHLLSDALSNLEKAKRWRETEMVSDLQLSSALLWLTIVSSCFTLKRYIGQFYLSRVLVVNDWFSQMSIKETIVTQCCHTMVSLIDIWEN